MLSEVRWTRLMSAFGITPEAGSFNALVDAYSQKHRHYHTMAHIENCLEQLDSASGIAAEPAETELALWFHDAVYDPYSPGNEEKSAALATALLERHGVAAERVRRVHDHIMATRHEAPAQTPDSKLVVDIDLSILGAEADAYAEFEANVRKEYRWVPALLFRRKRAEILESFLSRPQLYQIDVFRERYETRARHNLAQAIADLRR